MFSLHPAAELDIANAMDFYAEHAGKIVAKSFLDEFERVAMLLDDHPELGVPISNGRRIFPLQIFPYSIVYKDVEDQIRVLVVRHQHRRPGFGLARR